MNRKIHNLKLGDFAKLFGTKTSDIHKTCRKIIAKYDFHYRKVSVDEQTEIIHEINKKISRNNLFHAGKDSKPVWQKMWTERLENLIANDLEIDALVPKYLIKDSSKYVIYNRLFSSFIRPTDHNFELNWNQVYKHWLFEKYFKDTENIYEFGCGSGINIPVLVGLFPKKNLHFLDWTKQSKNIVELLAKKYGWNLSGYVFDMLHPKHDFAVKKNSAFLAFASLEQLGTAYKPFIEFAIQKKVSVFVTVGTVKELYDLNQPLEHLAVKYTSKREYLSGYLNYLRQLESQKRIEILKAQRVFLGNMFHDGYSYIVWRPTNT